MSRQGTHPGPRVPHAGAVNQSPSAFRNAQVSHGCSFLIARGNDELSKLCSIDAGCVDASSNAFASRFELFNEVPIVNGDVSVVAIFSEAQLPQFTETFVTGFRIGRIQIRVPAFQLVTPRMNAEAVEGDVILTDILPPESRLNPT